jgi:hypothetical protein
MALQQKHDTMELHKSIVSCLLIPTKQFLKNKYLMETLLPLKNLYMHCLSQEGLRNPSLKKKKYDSS